MLINNYSCLYFHREVTSIVNFVQIMNVVMKQAGIFQWKKQKLSKIVQEKQSALYSMAVLQNEST